MSENSVSRECPFGCGTTIAWAPALPGNLPKAFIPELQPLALDTWVLLRGRGLIIAADLRADHYEQLSARGIRGWKLHRCLAYSQLGESKLARIGDFDGPLGT